MLFWRAVVDANGFSFSISVGRLLLPPNGDKQSPFCWVLKLRLLPVKALNSGDTDCASEPLAWSCEGPCSAELPASCSSALLPEQNSS